MQVGNIKKSTNVEKFNETTEVVKRLSSASEICNTYFQETGLHGINKLQKSESDWYRRLFWGCAILACAIYLLLTMVREIQTFLSYPTTSSIKLDVLNEIDFPAVTICNLSPYNKSKMNSDDKMQNYFMSIDPYLSSLATPINWSDPYYRENGFFEPDSREYWMNGSMELLTFLEKCIFDNQEKPCDVYFKPVFTPMGPCFTFNHDGMVNTSMSGAGYNLVVEAFIDQMNYFYGISSAGSGVKIIIHESKDEPDVINKGVVVKPGSLAYISISQEKFSYLPYPYKAFKNGYCLDTEATSFKNPLKNSTYSTVSCIEECYRDTLEEVANCSVITSRRTENKPWCSKFEFHQLSKYFVTLYLNRTVGKMCLEKCTIPCSYTKYESEVNFADYPSDFFASELRRLLYPSLTDQFMRSNFLRIQVHYKELVIKTTQQTAVYGSWEVIFANLGGQMGLFLGASIITASELIEFVLRLIVSSSRNWLIKTRLLK